MTATKKVTASKASTKKAISAKSVKAPAKKSIFHKIFKSQKGLIKQKALSKSQFLITAAILGTIGIAGVVASHAGRLEDIAAPTASEYHCGTFTDLGVSSRGACVSYAQALLNYNNHYQTKSSISVDGQFGKGTQAAVVAFQNSRGLTPDGVIGSQTWTALRRVSTQALNRTQVANATKVAAQAGVKPRVVAPVVISHATPSISLTTNNKSYRDPETKRTANQYCVVWNTKEAPSNIKNVTLYSISNKNSVPARNRFSVIGAYSGNGSKCYDTDPNMFYYVSITAKDSGKTGTSGNVNL